MNILFFSRLFYPHIGGVEKHVLEISRRLISKGHKVKIITEELLVEAVPGEENIDGIDVYRIPVGGNNWFKKFRIWFWLLKNIDLIKKTDIVHCHDVFFWYLPFRFLFPFKKAYTTFHGYEDYPLKSKHVFMHKLSERLSNGNICVGQFISKWYKTKPAYVTYGGVGEIKNQKSKIKNENSAVFIGRLDEQTGIKTYADAVKLIRKKISDFEFKIIGDGKFRKELEKNFEVLGFQSRPEKYFSKYNFAFVSRYLSILEAMAAGRLVFAVYDNPLKEDYLRMAPFSRFINIFGLESELAESVFYFLKHPKEKNEMINNAYAWVKKYTWDEVTDMYLKLWI